MLPASGFQSGDWGKDMGAIRLLSRGAIRRLLSGFVAGVFLLSTTLTNVAPSFGASMTPSEQQAPSSTRSGSQTASPTVVRELVASRTADSNTYLLSNGELESRHTIGGAVNYLDPKTRNYVPIDAGLADRTVAGRTVSVNKANRFRLELPRDLANDWVKMGSAEGTVSMHPVTSGLANSATAASGTVLSSSPSTLARTYANAFAGASLAYESQDRGLKESIVIPAPSSASIYSFTLVTEGLTPKAQEDGSIGLFRGEEATPTYTIPRPFMTDSRTPHDENAYSDQVHYALVGSASPYRLDVIADAAWLSDPARAYPVKIDPSVQETSDHDYDTFISSSKPTTNYESDTAMWVGNGYSGYQLGEWRPTSTFDTEMNNRLAGGYQVASSIAQVWAQDHFVWGNVFAVNRPTYYIPSTVTWNSPADHSWTIREASTYVGGLAWYNFDTTDIVKAWSQSPGSFKGLQFYCDPGVKISFATQQTSIHHPVLLTRWAGTPTVALNAPYGSGTPSITIPGQGVSWTYAENLTTFPQVEYQVQVASSPSGPAIASSDVVSGATGDSLPVPPGGWNWGQTYYVRVAVASDPDNTYTPRLWSAWTDWKAFKPVPTAPTTAMTTPATGTPTFAAPQAAWSYAESLNLPQSEYQLEVVTSTAGPAIASSDVITSSCAATLPVPAGGWHTNTTYWARQRSACSPGGVQSWSVWTPWVSFTWTPPTPTVGAPTLATQATFPFKPQASWTFSEGLGNPQAEYQAAVSTSPVGPACVTADVVSASSGSIDLPTPAGGWQFGQTYYAQVRAASSPESGGPRVWSNWTSWVAFNWSPVVPVVNLTSPSATSSVLATPAASWTYSEALGNPQVEYQAQVATSPTGPAIASSDTFGTATQTPLPAPASGWQQNQTYYVSVRAASQPVIGSSVVWSAFTTPTAFTYLPTPGPVANTSVTTTASAAWFAEQDTNHDGLNDVKDDANTAGRGSVQLSWPAAASASGYNVYLSDGVTYRKVASTTATGWSSAAAGIYPSDTAISALANGTTSNPYLAGTGLDLRDDPTPLYARTTGLQAGLTPSYFFKVVAYNSVAEGALSAASTVTVTLENRTARLVSSPRHTACDLGGMGSDRASLLLDAKALSLSSTDLSIESFGPAAEISRVYVSSQQDAGHYFGPGWRFNFEQNICVDASGATYTDANRDAYRFTKLADGSYLAPIGDYRTLASTSAASRTGVAAAWQLTEQDRRSNLLFDSSGNLIAETDNNGNQTTYTWTSPSQLEIQAANLNKIVLTLNGSGTMTAQHSAGSAWRRVDYTLAGVSAAATQTATWSYSDASPGHANTYVVVTGKITRAVVSQDRPFAYQSAPSTQAAWDFAYNTTNTVVTAPSYDAAHDRAVTAAAYSIDASGLATADVIRSGEVSGTPNVSIHQLYGINPGGTTAYRTNPYVTGDAKATWRYTYSPYNDDLSQTNPDGYSTSKTFDGSGNVLTETDEMGRVTRHAYDGMNEETRSVDPRGSESDTNYDSSGNIISVTRALNDTQTATTLYEYNDAHGRMTLERQELYFEVDGVSHWATTAYSYDASDGTDRATTTNQYGETLANGTFARENVDLGTGVASGPAQVTQSAQFDAFGNQTRSTDASGNSTTNAFDAAGRQTSSTDALNLASVQVFDGLGRTVASWKQAGDQVALYQQSDFDAFGRVAETRAYRTTTDTSTTQLDHKDTNVYDASGRLTSAHDSLSTGTDATTWHDAAGNALYSWVAGARDLTTPSATKTKFDAEGRAVQATAPGSNAYSTTAYNPDGQVRQTVGADRVVDAITYDTGGAKWVETNASGTTTSVVDVGGRVVSVTDARLSVTSYGYDLAGRQTSACGATGPASTTSFNALGWPLVRTDADGVPTADTYDVCGRVVSEAVGSGASAKTTVASFDAQGRPLTRINPDGLSETWHYDSLGNVDSDTQRKADGSTIKDATIVTDSLGRTSSSTDLRGVTHVFGYPAQAGGLVTDSVVSATATTTLSADAAGHEVSREATFSGLSYALTRSITATDAAGRTTGYRLNWGWMAIDGGYTYDDAGRIESRWGPAVSGDDGFIPWESYDWQTGRKDYEAIMVSGARSRPESNYTYTTDGRLSGVGGFAAGSFAYDAAGNVSTYTATTDASAWGPTAADNGTNVQTSGVLAYDSSGRLNALKALDGSVVETFTFDSHGARTGEKLAAESTPVRMTYTGQNGLATYHKPGGALGVTASVDATYTYDATGQRTHSSVTSGAVSVETTFTYDGLKLLSLSAAQTGDTTATWHIDYVYDDSGRPFAGLYRSDTAGSIPFSIVTTTRGDVVEIVSGPTANFQVDYRYDAWGRPVRTDVQGWNQTAASAASEIAARQPLRYAGYVYDNETGFYYLSARTYDPSTMQFLQKDPAKADGEESAYQYCSGDPVGSADPSGLSAATLMVPNFPQERPHWCATACIQMVVDYLTGNLYSQRTIEVYATGVPYDRGLTVIQTVRALQHYRVHVTFSYGKISWSDLKTQLDQGKPLIIDEGVHAIVVYGYSETHSEGRTDQMVYAIDPDPSIGFTNHIYSWWKSWKGSFHSLHKM